MLKKYKLFFLVIVITIASTAISTFLIVKPTNSFEVPITIFPLDNYDQNIEPWIKPTNPDYNEPLISSLEQNKQTGNLYNHLYATGKNAASPWDSKYVEGYLAEKLEKRIAKQPLVEKYCAVCNQETLLYPDKAPATSNDYTENLSQKIGCYQKQRKIGYASNFRPYNEKWFKDILHNMDLDQFIQPVKFQPKNRGIAVKNLFARALPTNDPFFYHASIAGEGYPFDNLQESAIWVGTPIYIIGKTLDQQWFLVMTPSYIAWVESIGIAKTGTGFIKQWQRYAKKKMVAINKTNVPVFDTKNRYRFNAYIGTMFPVKTIGKDSITALIPIAGIDNHAKTLLAKINKGDANIVPLPLTPHNFAKIISTLIGRPYGWGNMYFYNDCSAELKNLYTPFGIWLPRNSYQQTKNRELIDLSDLTVRKRLKYLIENGKKMLTIIYVTGHTMIYVGNYPNPNSAKHEPMVMTYQTPWALKPKNGSYRSVIGKSVFFPLLETYPEDPKLESLVGRELLQIFHLNKSLLDDLD